MGKRTDPSLNHPGEFEGGIQTAIKRVLPGLPVVIHNERTNLKLDLTNIE